MQRAGSVCSSSPRAIACEEFIADVKHFGFTRIREWKPIEKSFEEIRQGIFK